MRPLPGSTAFPGTPSSSDGASDCLASASQSTAAHMSFILTDEATIDSSLAPQYLPLRTRDQRKHAIHTVPGDISAPNRELGTASPATASRSTPTLQPRDSTPPRSVPATNTSPARVHTPPPIASQPMTPILYGVSGPCSAISSSSSRRNSLVGSLSEYQESFVMSAFGSSEPGQPQSSYVGEGAQQFIMPTINVPSRRPFTETGKSLGRLKLLMAGRSGLLPGNALPSDPPIGQGTFQITETFASTKPYPPWWKGSVQGSFMSSSTSTDDTILDRNVCLVDTPGYQETCRVSQYVESHLQKNRLNGLEDSDVLKTIGGSGGLLVDAVLYTIPSSGLTSTDFQYIRQLESLTNVLPLVAHADVLTSEQITESKERIAKQLTEAGIRLFTFAPPASNRDEPDIYAISSKLGLDLDVMDASLLMGSEYVQPLVPTDLSRLLESIFSVDGATWLRHAAATKLLSWRLRHPRTSISSTGLTLHPEGHVDRRLLRTQTGSLTPLATSLVPRYAHHEERFCRIQFTDWAADLQRSLANERVVQERTARAQAATWMGEALRGGLGDEANEAMALTRTRGRRDHQRPFNRRHSTGSTQNWALARHQDPLGLLQLKADFRWQGWNTLEMVGGLGLLGGLAWLLV
ncbi:Heat shock protein [Colletotrichum higginsianum IMI 349063]|uniref:Heat shock protein n=2 Tax=Colletotrichum higginsianum (strain IMI 349063) TaxID=759273 RepID=A0A1B7YPM9_COLHI|nr:Heat shock protein [Colletotrichum higginsianum IMI 349063]OBR13848.1 Heat shock protein [Colletotrichum higginsianum IMI 349063]